MHLGCFNNDLNILSIKVQKKIGYKICANVTDGLESSICLVHKAEYVSKEIKKKRTALYMFYFSSSF